jgi:calcineurin-like phosphoesterase
MTSKVINYTDEQTKHIVEEYTANPTRDTVDALANELGKTVKSIIGKLSREKVYQKKEYITKRGEKPITKVEMVGSISKVLDIDPDSISGLVKSSKSDLMNLQEAIDAISSNCSK